MFIKVEPAEFFMYRVILIFDQESPDSEDPEVRNYLSQWELEPKHQRTADVEGRNSQIMQFGGCYLGRHLGKISEIQRTHVEQELLTAEIHHILQDPDHPLPIPEPALPETIRQLTQRFHTPDAFRPNADGLLEATLDPPAVRQAARQLIQPPPVAP